MTTLTQLGLILCILGLAAAFPNEDNPIDLPLEEALDTAVNEPLNTIKNNVNDLGVSFNASGKKSDSQENTNSPEKGKCKKQGLLCFRSRECCSGRCHFFGRTCDDGTYEHSIGTYLL